MQATQVQIVLSSHVNGIGRLFGGQLMSWIDVTGAVAARRFCKSEVVTLTVDRLQFFKGVRMNQTLELDARVTWAGRTSMEVRVDTYVDPLTGERELVNRAYLVCVAVDRHGNKVAVPPFVPQSEEEIQEFEAAKQRRAQRLAEAGR